MHSILARNNYFVKEHVGFFKAANNYDIHDPDTQEMIMECREENLGFMTKMFRFSDYKRMTPFDLVIRTTDGKQVCRVKRGVSFFISKVDVLDENDMRIGGFKQKWLSIGGAFDVLGPQDQVLCSLKGKWTGWEFSFKVGDNELGKVSKKFAGALKEIFTSADNYMLQISPQVPANDPVRVLILGAVMSIDLVLKE